jgi:heme-degrading monooxygenase HmoA
VYARSTMVDAHPSTLDAGVAHVREQLLPTALEVDGCVGLSMLVAPVSGRCVVTTAWRSAEAMQAGGGRLRPAYDRLGVMLQGRPDDEDWEIAVVHRAHRSRPGACVRAVRVQVDPERMDHGVDLYRMVLLPQIEEFPGFSSASLWVDRTSGHAVSSVTFDSHEAMRRTRNLAAVVRERGTQEASGEVLDVDEFELALAHLHVPELI